jgi:hypothetical protein
LSYAEKGWEICLEKVLRRTVHDLGNTVSGVLSLSEQHLTLGIEDSALRESIELMNDSAVRSRDLLLQVTRLFEPFAREPSPVRVSEFMTQLHEALTLLLPRDACVRFEAAESEAAILVPGGALLRAFLCLAAIDLDRRSVAQISIGFRPAPEAVSLFYRSETLGSGEHAEPEVLKQGFEQFGPQSLQIEQEGGTLTFAVTFKQAAL